MFSCLGLCKKSSEEEREPLLPQHRDDTDRQHELRRKLRTYQRLRAVADGYMPSNEQVIANLRSLLASDVLNSQNEDLSDSGRTLVHYVKKLAAAVHCVASAQEWKRPGTRLRLVLVQSPSCGRHRGHRGAGGQGEVESGCSGRFVAPLAFLPNCYWFL